MEIKMLAKSGVTRRHFIKTAIAAVGAAALPFGVLPVRAAAKYRRYNVESPEGKKALQSYANGIRAMLARPASDPQNWFRNAFTHLMDCPHGNWWFYAWHRGYIGYFEQTIRNLSGDDSFTIPYWDWTSLPRIPDSMFDDVLTPTDQAFEPYTRDLDTFAKFIQPAVKDYCDKLNAPQKQQFELRYPKGFPQMWDEVATGNGDLGNRAFAETENARYLTRDNPDLDCATTVDVKPGMIVGGLFPTDFYNDDPILSFTSSKTTGHSIPPGGNTFFSELEGFPHNKTHNCIGGVGAIDPPFGNMTNNLSPVDPLFFLHHSNMDRLWDIWTRKQKHCGWSALPSDDFYKDAFLFYVNGRGEPVTDKTNPGDYLSTEMFDYDYEPGFGEQVISAACPGLQAKQAMLHANAIVKGGTATVTVPAEAIKAHLKAETAAVLFAEITVHRDANSGREFEVFIEPSDVTDVSPESPYNAGTLAFFGHTANMGPSQDVTFVVPLPKTRRAFHNLTAAKETLNIRVVPHGHGHQAPALKAVSIQSR